MTYTSHFRLACKCPASRVCQQQEGRQSKRWVSRKTTTGRPCYRSGSSCGSGVSHTLEPESGASHIATNCAVTGIHCQNRLSRSNLGMWPPYWKGSGAGSPQTMTCLSGIQLVHFQVHSSRDFNPCLLVLVSSSTHYNLGQRRAL